VIPYASRTGTRRNLAALKAANWRLLISATGAHRPEGFPYAIDNGAWTSHQSGSPFDADRFRACVEGLGAGADWLIAPDIVQGGLESLELSVDWLPWCLKRCSLVLIAVQDGMEPRHVESMLSPRVGIAIGGSTEWKERQLSRRVWRAPWVHCLRVNTARRIALCAGAVDSFDGTSASRYASSLPRLDGARRQLGLFRR